MRSLKINFGGPNDTSIAWGEEVSGLPAVAQRAGVALMTQEGSDKFIPERGTDVVAELLSYGAFDLLGIQHLLNFGALKARSDMQAYETPDQSAEDRVASIRVTLMDVHDRIASVAVVVTNQAGQSSREVVNLA
jgi:hypothetical protein